MDMASFSVVGKRIPKLDALDKVTGRVVYGHDLRLPGMLHGKILYSEQAHARVVRLDTSRARRLAGVKAVITAADNPSHKFGFARDNTPLKGDRVRCYADAVAAVAATLLPIALWETTRRFMAHAIVQTLRIRRTISAKGAVAPLTALKALAFCGFLNAQRRPCQTTRIRTAPARRTVLVLLARI